MVLTIKSLFFSLINATYSSATPVTSFYPKPPDLRLEGIDQSYTQRCLPTAIVTAFEHAFEREGLPLRFSLAYTQAAYGLHFLSPEQSSIRRLAYSEYDRQLIHRLGDFIPDECWPEDFSGVDDRHCKLEMGNTLKMINSERWQPLPLRIDYKTTCIEAGTEDSLITRVREDIISGKVMLLTLPRYYFRYFDPETGLKQRTNQCPSTMDLDTVNHPVALVGFADELYEGQGALIIKNTWDNPQRKSQFILKKKTGIALQSDFLSRIGSIGYYALPYADVIELARLYNLRRKNAGLIRLVTLTKPSLLEIHEAYKLSTGKTPTFHAPFVCSQVGLRNIIEAFFDRHPFFQENELAGLRSRILRLHSQNPLEAPFKVARLSGLDNLRRFYSNEEPFRSFYCPQGSVIPTLESINSIGSIEDISKILGNSELDDTFWTLWYRKMVDLIKTKGKL